MKIIRVLCVAVAAAGLAVVTSTATSIIVSDEASAQGGRPGNYKTKKNQQSKNRPSNYQGNWNQTLTRKGGSGQVGYTGKSRGSKSASGGSSRTARPPGYHYMRGLRPGDRPPENPSMLRNLCEGLYCFFVPGPPTHGQRPGIIKG
jgi:hypothetical protein